MSILSSGTSNTTALVYTSDTTGNLVFQTNGTTEAMRIDTSGNVGIGTTAPSSKLYVASAATQAIVVGQGNIGTDYGIGRDNSNGSLTFYGNQTGAVSYVFSGINGERMRIDTSGNLLVGTTSNVGAPARGAFIGNSTYGGLAAEAPGSGSGYPVWFRDTDATSASQQLVHIIRGASIVGYITTTNTTTSYQSASDYRLKEDVATMTGALAKIAQLNPVTYKWKTDGSDGQGFIAHELAQVFPDAVSGEKDAIDKEGNILPQAIDQSKLVATLVAAIQELNAKVDAQAAEIAALKGNN